MLRATGKGSDEGRKETGEGNAVCLMAIWAASGVWRMGTGVGSCVGGVGVYRFRRLECEPVSGTRAPFFRVPLSAGASISAAKRDLLAAGISGTVVCIVLEVAARKCPHPLQVLKTTKRSVADFRRLHSHLLRFVRPPSQTQFGKCCRHGGQTLLSASALMMLRSPPTPQRLLASLE